MYKLISTFLCSCIFIVIGYSQNPWELGAEYQHGFSKNYNSNIPGARYEGFKNKSSWSFGINYNFSSAGSGKDAAKGSGFGLYGEYRYGFSYGTSGNLFGGLRTSFTFGKDDKGTKYSLFTPSLETGYHYTFNNFGKGGYATPSLSIGYDFKLNSEKETPPAHEGPVFFPGVSIGYRF